MRSELRSEDASGRLGGDEFCFVLPNVDQEEAARLAERIRERLNTMAFGMNGGGAPIHGVGHLWSGGLAVAHGRPRVDGSGRPGTLRAKASGRNRVCVDA